MTPPDPDFTWSLEHPLPRTPFGDAWSARAGDGTPAMVITVAPELVAIVPDRARLAGALGTRAAGHLAHDALVADASVADTFVPLLDVLVAPDGGILLVLPPEERAPASARLARARTFSTSDVAEAARALGAALDVLHGMAPAAMRHGALAPGMLYMGDGRPVRVIGAGLAEAFVEAGARRDLVLDALGARQYAAPELTPDADAAQAADAPPTTAGDVYALGATLYACMTGRPPFGGRTTAMIMANVLADEDLTGEVPAFPWDDVATQRLTQALLRAVERAPEDRWPTAGDFVRGLDGRVPTPSPMFLPPVPTRTRLRAAARSALRAFLQHRFLARLLPRQELR